MLAADLVAGSAEFSQASIERGEDLTVSVAFENAGDADAAFFRINVFLTSDDVVGNDDDVLLTQIRRVSGLAQGLSDSSSREVIIPADTDAGEYYLGFTVDVAGVVTENSEQNNTFLSGSRVLEVMLDDSDDGDDSDGDDDDSDGDDDSPDGDDDDNPDGDDGDDDDSPGGDDGSDEDDDGVDDGDDSADDDEEDEEIGVFGREQEIDDDDLRPAFSDGTAFGRVNSEDGTRGRTFVIRNSGEGDLEIDDIRLEGLNASSFSLDGETSVIIAPGGEFSFDVVFDPTSNGLKRARVVIQCDDLDEGEYVFRVAGRGSAQEQPNILVTGRSQNAIDNGDDTPDASRGTRLGPREIGEFRDRTFTITNLGNATLNLTSPIGISGRDPLSFVVIEAPDDSIAPGESRTFVLRFAPQETGAQRARVTIFSDDPDTSEYAFSVRGLGLEGNDD